MENGRRRIKETMRITFIHVWSSFIVLKPKNLPDIPPVFPIHFIIFRMNWQNSCKRMQSFHLQELEKYHDFGLTNSQSGLGKMIGVLVVQTPKMR